MSISNIITNKAYLLIIIYAIMAIYQMYYIKTYILNWHSYVVGSKTDHMQWNIENKSKLNEEINAEISKRLKMLDNMTYVEWLAYNNENPQIQVGEYKYPIAVYERVKNDIGNYNTTYRFLLRAHPVQELLGLTFEELLKQANYTFLFSIFSPHPKFLDTIFNSSHYDGGTNIYALYSVDSDINRPVKSNAIGGSYIKKMDHGDIFEGVIYSPYSLLDVEEQYANKYYDFLPRSFLVTSSLTTLVVALLLFYVSGKNAMWLPFVFLIAANRYILNFLDVVEGITTLENEEAKVKDINEGILSISFLAAVNIFIIQSLRDSSNKSDYYEPSILFMLGLVMLLLSLYKITNYNRIDEIRVHRIEKQFMYNGSIYVNLFILIFYSLFIVRKSKIIDYAYKTMVGTIQ